jgi:hypothetical protein
LKLLTLLTIAGIQQESVEQQLAKSAMLDLKSTKRVLQPLFQKTFDMSEWKVAVKFMRLLNLQTHLITKKDEQVLALVLDILEKCTKMT